MKTTVNRVSPVRLFSRSSAAPKIAVAGLKDRPDSNMIKELNKKISRNPIIITNGQAIREINRLHSYDNT